MVQRSSRNPRKSPRWTGDKAAAFLKTLAQSGKVAPAARSVGMSRQAAYRLRERAPKFAEMWDMALEQAAMRRGMERAAARAVHPLLAPDYPQSARVPRGEAEPGNGSGRGA